MNRFVKSGSRLFLLVAWGSLCTLFADGANLDDIFSSNYVIHDDEDVASGLTQTVPSADHMAPGVPDKVPRGPVRVIVDQDSPSLAAESDAFTLVAEAKLSDALPVTYETILTVDALHIKFRTLLI